MTEHPQRPRAGWRPTPEGWQAIGRALLVIEVLVAGLSVFLAYVFLETYGDPSDSTLDLMTSGSIVQALLIVGVAAVGAVLTLRRPLVRVMAAAIPVLMVVGMLVAIPAALTRKREDMERYGGAVSSAGWRVVEGDGHLLRADREGMAFDVAL